jgi:hypothetical protein
MKIDATKQINKRQITWSAVLVIILVLSYYMLFIEPNNIVVNIINVEIGSSRPQKIVFISDIHIETISDVLLDNIVETSNAQNPDYIFLGGDFTEGSEIGFTRLKALQGLRSKNGIFAVLGNHDYPIFSCNDQDITNNPTNDELNIMNIHVLRNENIDLGNFVLIGIDDLWACRSNYSKAIEGTNRSKPAIVLSHNSQAIPEDEFEKLSLVLSGHTHCGQVRLPIIGSPLKLVGLINKYDAGLNQFDNNSYIYTTCGIGGGPRFMAPPEINVFEIS